MRLPDLLLVLIYLVAITLFGLRFARGDRSLRSYFLGGRTIPWWAIALSIVSAETSTLTIISVPGVAYAGDFGFLQIVFGYMLGRVMVCVLFLPKYFQGELFTAYQLIDRRFGPSLHKITALLFLLTRAAAEGVRVFAVSIVVGIAIGTRDTLSIAIITALTLVYTFEGGIAAVIWTDVVQMFIYIGGTFVALWTLGHHVDGGWTAIHAIAGSAGKLRVLHFGFSLTQTYTFWAGLLGGTFLTMASHGTDQLMVQRLLVAKNLRESRLALMSSGLIILMQFTLFLLIGAGLYVFYLQHPPAVAFASADHIFPAYIVQQMPAGVAGLLIAAILAAAMSNLSAALNSLSSTTVIDFYLRWRPESTDRERNMISRASTVMWALVLFALALLSRGGGHVVEIGLSIASVAYGSLLGVFLLGTVTKRANENGAIIGMILGFALNVTLWMRQAHPVWIFARVPLIAWTWYVLIGAIVTFAVGYLASIFIRPAATHAKTVIVLLLLFTASHAARAQAPDFTPIDGLVQKAIAGHQIPGAVVLIGHDGKIVFHKAYGNRSLEIDHKPHIEPMTEDTIFDMASLTKPLATATALMQLYDQHLFNFDDPVAKYIPAFAVNGKQNVTIRQLATHFSGLPPDIDKKEIWTGKQEGFARADAIALQSPPGTVFRYSDVNYVVLQQLIEKLAGDTLDHYALTHIYQPLGMAHTRFLPPASWIPNIAPTQYDENGIMLRGVVHDPTARRMGGVAGDAGLFSTANDVAIYAQKFIRELAGRPDDFPVSRDALRVMATPQQPPDKKDLRGIGWDINTDFSSTRGDLFPVGSFGHTGFTGTSLWMDVKTDTYVIILTNRVHPNGGVSINKLRSDIATVAAAVAGYTKDGCPPYDFCDPNIGVVGGEDRSIKTIAPTSTAKIDSPQSTSPPVLTGIDVLEADRFTELEKIAERHDGHLRLGLLTNQTGLDSNGHRTIDILNTGAAKAVSGLQLTTLFSPEHGIAGAVDSEKIDSTTDKATGLPVISLYGSTDAQKRPSIDELKKLDAVVIDLQDAGVRFFTYETITGYFLEAAAKAGIEIIVLDRPNPINGVTAQGPVSDAGAESYRDYMPMPVREGLTLGELARYFNGEKKLGAQLTVIPMRNWDRLTWFDETALPWTNPSPNLKSVTEEPLYPGVAFLDSANISVGRGTANPFELVGAPYVDGPKLAAYLTAREIPGVSFSATTFSADKPYLCSAAPCSGIHITLTDRTTLDSPELGLEIVSALHHLYPEFQLEKVRPLIANAATMDALRRGDDPRSIAATWQPALKAYQQRAMQYLLYK